MTKRLAKCNRHSHHCCHRQDGPADRAREECQQCRQHCASQERQQAGEGCRDHAHCRSDRTCPRSDCGSQPYGADHFDNANQSGQRRYQCWQHQQQTSNTGNGSLQPARHLGKAICHANQGISHLHQHWHQRSAELDAQLNQFGLQANHLVIHFIGTFGKFACHSDAQAFYCFAATI